MLRSLLMTGSQATGFLSRIHPLSKLFLSLALFSYTLAVRSPYSLAAVYLTLLVFLGGSGLVRPALQMFLPSLLVGAGMFFVSFLLGGTLADASVFALRILIFFQAFIIFGATTSPASFLRSLHALKLPPPLCMGLLIVLRFIPVLAAEMKAIALSYSLRKKANRLSLPLFYRGIMVPFVYRLFTLADDLTLALHVRGFGNNPRPTSFRQVSLHGRDVLFLAAGLLALTALHKLTGNL